MASNPVITQQQARAITGGRAPLVPVEYETAVKALQACATLDEAKYWSDKSDALAAWAKIYHSKEADIAARRLKLHAYRRMGELAAELRPKKGGEAGPKSLLMEHGFGSSQARDIRRITAVPRSKFDAAINRKQPPSVYALSMVGRGNLGRDMKYSETWRTMFDTQGGPGFSLHKFETFCEEHDAKKLAKALPANEAALARAKVVKIQEWLDEFEQHLTKAKS